MKKVELRRVEQSEDVTIGVLTVDGEGVCWCLEEPWRENEPDVSCIPAGTYPLALEHSPSKGRMLWTIKDVQGRSYVRIHIGNSVDDTAGCVLPGELPVTKNERREVEFSARAFGKFLTAMGDGEATAQITVINVDGSKGEQAEGKPKPEPKKAAKAKDKKEEKTEAAEAEK
ncbi:DUF5675 family protein [Maridesulfovibrio sp.]|uniref:DUF5675 family protein n=1 Tax=Maridesulfovibrio sp. TaxID=2795000 RepID=UPI002A18A878|nr:DUF5675 family protein [Maridesulfovibrio sp.]